MLRVETLTVFLAIGPLLITVEALVSHPDSWYLSCDVSRAHEPTRGVGLAGAAPLVLQLSPLHAHVHDSLVSFWFWLRHIEYDVWLSVRVCEGAAHCNGDRFNWVLVGVLYVSQPLQRLCSQRCDIQ